MNPATSTIEGCKKGDQRAQYQLYRDCFSTLKGICHRYRENEHDVDALVNLGFLKIINNLDKLDQKEHFESWIRRIMINVLIDDFRKNRNVRDLIEWRDFSENEHLKHPIDLNHAEKVFDYDDLLKMIKKLPPVSSKVFNLFAIDGFSHAEIAEMFGISEGTSKWHVSFARKKLAEMMSGVTQTHKVV